MIIAIIFIIRYFTRTVIIEPKKNIIKISTSDFDYKKAESVIGLESIKQNYIILNDTLNTIIDLLILCENRDIKPINTTIYYTIPSFLENPTSGALRIVKSDIIFYKNIYEKLSEKTNNLTEITNKSIDNISISLYRTKNEIEKLFYQFKEKMIKLAIPFITKEKIFSKKARNLDEIKDTKLDEEQIQINSQLEEYKNDIDKLNSLYNDYFSYNYETVKNISDEINEIQNTTIVLQNKIEEGKSNFENKCNDFSNPNDIQSLHSNLIGIKSDLGSIKNEGTSKQNTFGRRERTKGTEGTEGTESTERTEGTERISSTNNNYDYRNFNNEINEIDNKIIEGYDASVIGISGYTEKKTTDRVEIPKLYASNIIVDSIKESLNRTVYIIKNEESIIYYELKEFNDEINVEERTSLDLLFIMDTTLSMKGFLNQVKNSIINIIDRITIECPGIDIYIGYVSYTDIWCADVCNVDFEFTKNYEDLKTLVKNLRVWRRRLDPPEDIEWGLERALEKNWKSNARFAILFGDYPCHGYQYHSHDMADDYPNGNPTSRNIEEIIKDLAEKNISLYCAKITKHTDLLFQIFGNIYKGYPNCQFKVVPLESDIYLSDTVVYSASEVYINQRNIDIN